MKMVINGIAIMLISGLVSGCALQVAGEAIRSSQKEFDMMYAPGTTAQVLANKQSIAVSVSGAAPGQMAVAAHVGTGGTNSALLSDMIMKELFRSGYQAKSLTRNVSDTDVGQFKDLASQGFDMALVGNMNMSMTTSVIGHLTGGSMMNTGVTDFTIKGIELPSGKLLFIMSGRYGVAKNPADVAVDVAATYKSKLTGGI